VATKAKESECEGPRRSAAFPYHNHTLSSRLGQNCLFDFPRPVWPNTNVGLKSYEQKGFTTNQI